jgi:pimeloyl-ACP methyl ester carboxylesterase
LYLVCSGQQQAGRPTVILVSGYHDSSDPWTQPDVLSLSPPAVGPAVLPGLARYGLVCAYDRPGTLRYVTGLPLTERSTPVPQPRTALDLVTELHELLALGGVPAAYILVGHSLGGLVVQLYARLYPHQVQGVVFIDAFSPTLRSTLGALWPLYRDVLNPPPRDEPIPSLALPDSERVNLDVSVDEVEHARPLRPMPLIVLTKTEPFRIAPGRHHA